MKTLKCPSCGAPIKKDAERCEYCGAVVSHDDEKKSFIDQIDDSLKDIGKKIKVSFKPDFSWIILLLLLIFLFPVGIVYLIFNVDTNPTNSNGER